MAFTANHASCELLSPAGRPEALRAAVQNGADAVYLGEKSFSARKNAVNFTWEEIRSAVSYCHVRGVKVHLALNTLIAEDELKSIEKAAEKAAESGVDAVIVQDLGAADIIHRVCPDLPMHASTQLTAYSAADVNYLSRLGFTRVVLSRELSCSEIEEIRRQTTAELEAFVHGALCICFSGRCLMSSFIGGRSGNRGMCAQPCRKLYFADKKTGYLLSPRDLCLADEITAMKKAGITSFKIEGRMKSPEYVAAVTAVYRRCIDSGKPLTPDDEKLLKEVFVRGDGFTKGYFTGLNTPEIMNYNISNDNITGRTDKETLLRLRRTYNEEIENKKIGVTGRLTVKLGRPACFTLSDGDGNTASVYGEMPEKAVNMPLNPEDAAKRMCKMGQTPFSPKHITADIDDGLMLSAASLNRLRRDCCKALAEKRGQISPRKTFRYDFKAPAPRKKTSVRISAQVMTAEQFSAAQDADIIIVPLFLWNKIEPNGKCALLLPPMIQDAEQMLQTVRRINPPGGVYVPSAGVLQLLSEKNITAFADYGFNIYNSISARIIGGICSRITLSPELSLQAIAKISSALDAETEIIAYGYQTVMISRACLLRGIKGSCDCREGVIIRDKTGAEFTVYGDSQSHINTVINSRPTFMADRAAELYGSGASILRLVFTREDGRRTKEIIDMYRGKIPPVTPPFFTRGYFSGKAERKE